MYEQEKIPIFTPQMLILTNLLFIGVGLLFVLQILKDEGLSHWYALFYCFYSGFIIATFLDLSEPVAMGFLVGSIFFYQRSKTLFSVIFITSAILTKEINCR